MLIGLHGERGGSERILILVERALELSGIVLADVDTIAVSRGPGSLTGLRVGIAVARGLRVGAGKPLVGVSTLQALAAGEASGPLVLALLEAGRGELYGGLFRPGDPPVPLGQEQIGSPEEFAKAVAGRPVRLAGSAGVRHGALFPQAQWSLSPGEEFLAARVGRVAAALLEKDAMTAGSSGADAPGRAASPRYVRRHAGAVAFEE